MARISIAFAGLALAAGRLPAAGPTCTVPAGTILRPVLDAPVRMGRLAPGSTLDGRFTEPVYLGSDQVLAAGTRVHLSVDEVRKRPRDGPRRNPLANLDSLWLARRPREYTATLRSAALALENGPRIDVEAALLAVWNAVELTAEKSAGARKPSQPVAVIEVRRDFTAPACQASPADAGSGPKTIPAGAAASLMLLSPVSASSLHAGEVVRGRLSKPIWIDGQVALPEGAIFQAKVISARGPKWALRPGRLRLSWQGLEREGAPPLEAPATLAAVTQQRGTQLRLDEEGGLAGTPTSRKAKLLDIAAAYALGKVTDDLFEEGVKGVLGAAVSGSAATAARYVGIGVGATLFLLQHGHDVALPRYTEVRIVFKRPLAVPARPARPE